MKKHPVLIEAETLKTIINLLLPRERPDLMPRLQALLNRDPVQEKTDSTPEMFVVDVDSQFAQFVLDELAIIPEDHNGPESFRGAEVAALVRKWQGIVNLISN